MGPRRMCATLLLAAVVLQYHGVNAGACPTNPGVASACGTLPPFIGCEPPTPHAFGNCGPSLTKYIELTADAGKWKQLKGSECGPDGVWKGVDKDGTTRYDSIAMKNLVCAKIPPDSKSCKTSDNIKANDCSAQDPIQIVQGCTKPQPNDLDFACGSGTTLFFKSAGAKWVPATTTIACDKTAGKWTNNLVATVSADEVVCATSVADKIPCFITNPLAIDCDAETDINQDPSVACKPVTKTDDSPVSCDPNWNLFFSGSPGSWAQVTGTIACNQNSGEWENGGTALLPSDRVICAKRDPTKPKECQGTANALDSDCDQNEYRQGVTCEQVIPLDDSSSPTQTCQNQVFYKVNGGTAWEKVEGMLSCDTVTNGKWMSVGPPTRTFEAGRIICADKDPNLGACDSLLPEYCTGIATGCLIPDGVGACGTGNLYYLKKASTNWVQATSLSCANSQWKIAYNLGPDAKTEDFSVADDKVICMASNPTPDACQIGKFDFPDKNNFEFEGTGYRYVEAGQVGNCMEQAKYEMFFEDGRIMIRNSPIVPVCRPDGHWYLPGDQDCGKKFACRNDKCRTCQSPQAFTPDETRFHSISIGMEPFNVDKSGTCYLLDCLSNENTFVIRDDKFPKFRYFGGTLICDGKDQLYKDSDGVAITEARCIQMPYCYDPASETTKIECTPDIPGCEQLVFPPDLSTPYAELSCPTATKTIFMKKDGVDYWDTVKKIQCSKQLAKWEVVMIDPLDEKNTFTEMRDHKNTLICADANPKPKPLPVPPTVEPICTLCKSHLPTFLDCEACSKNGTTEGKEDFTLETNNKGEPKLEDKCIMKAVSGRKIVINNFEEKDSLECNRTDPNKHPDRTEWHTREGFPVVKFSARKDATLESWQKMSYVIVGLAFITIGGMGIGCFVIYFRMRKQPSSREKKKKERGVTKKYTSSNVVKTNQSNRSKEACKSKEPTGSKMDDQFEEAPTLKL